MNQKNEELKRELAGMVNSQRTAPKLEVDILKFNGQTGKFKKLENKDGKYLEMPEEKKNPEGIVIKVRRSLQAFGKDIQLFTNEHNSIADKLVLFEKSKDQNGKTKTVMIDEGMTKDLRDKYQNLRLMQVFYILIGNKRYKLNVKGKSLSNLFDFYAELSKTNSHIFEFTTKFKVRQEESQLGSYYALAFERGEDVELEAVAKEIKKLDAELKEIDEYYKSQNPTEEQEIKADEIPMPEEPAVDLPPAKPDEENEPNSEQLAGMGL